MGSDGELIQAARRGDQQAWDEIVYRYRRLVFSIPLNYGLSQSDAADIFQLTFMMLLQGLGSLQENSHLGGWLATVARRNTWHVIERRNRDKPLAAEWTDDERLPDKADETQRAHWELNNWLMDGLSRLDDQCRALLLHLYLDPEQPSYKEIALRMGIPLGSIGPTRGRCLKRLREIMSEE